MTVSNTDGSNVDRPNQQPQESHNMPRSSSVDNIATSSPDDAGIADKKSILASIQQANLVATTSHDQPSQSEYTALAATAGSTESTVAAPNSASQSQTVSQIQSLIEEKPQLASSSSTTSSIALKLPAPVTASVVSSPSRSESSKHSTSLQSAGLVLKTNNCVFK
jgi:hypothetical protein